jgi:outer membrane usher protein
VSGEAPGNAILSLAAARSGGQSSGSLAQLGLDVTHAKWNFGARWRVMDSGFRSPGMLESPALAALNVHLGVDLSRAGTLGLVLSRQSLEEQSGSRFISATYSVSVGIKAFVTAIASCGFERGRACRYDVMLTRPLSRRSQLQMTMGRSEQGATQGFALGRSPDSVSGVGYHLQAESAQQDRLAGMLMMNTPAMHAELGVERDGKRQGYSLGVSGGALVAGSEAFVCRDANSAGAVALLEGLPAADVPIYLDGRVVARSAGNGSAVITGLRAYETNRLHIDESDLPLGVQLRSNEVAVVPARDSVVKVRFETSATRGATVRLLRENREPVPAGARISVASREFVVADGGFGYLMDLQGPAALSVAWPGHHCEARIEVPANEVLPDLGPQICYEAL